MINTRIKDIMKKYDLKNVDVSRETIITIEGFKYKTLNITFDNRNFDNINEFEKYAKIWKSKEELSMEKVIKIRELKRDIKEGCYELMLDVEVERNLFLTMLLEEDNIVVHFENYNTMLQGTYKIDKMEILSRKKDEVIKLLNEIHFYSVDEVIEIDC